MSLAKSCGLMCLLLNGFLPASAQQIPTPGQSAPLRDARALSVLQQSLATLGGRIPSDSTATGTVEIVEGSLHTKGTIRILTRGTDQTAEFIQTDESVRSAVYSRLRADIVHRPLGSVDQASSRLIGAEEALSNQSILFSFLPVGIAVATPDYAIEYVALESLAGVSTHHIRLSNTFSAQRSLQDLAESTVRDVWIEAATGLPRKIAYEIREAGGDAPRIPLELTYSDYRNIDGILYPFRIEKSLNGTPWAAVTIAQVLFATGLADADFPIRQGAQ